MQPASIDAYAARVDELKEQGLVDMKFYPGVTDETVPAAFCEEAVRLFDAAYGDSARKLRFNDSKRPPR